MVAPFSHPFGESWLKGRALLYTAVFGVSAGFMLFGYDQGIANALTGNAEWQSRFASVATDTNKLGAVLGSFVLGAFLGALINFQLGNRLSRRTVLFIGIGGTVVAGALQAGAVELAMFTIFRTLNGLFVGMMTAQIPTYMSELSQRHVRGRMVSLELVLGASGLMTAFWVTYGFRNDTSQVGWRLPLAIQPMLAILSLGALIFSPESPRWLCENGRSAEGHAVLTRLYGEAYATEEIASIEEAIALEREAASQYKGLRACFQANDQCFRYRTCLGIGVNLLQQLTGINMATYYAGTIFIEAIGLGPERGLLSLGGLGIAGLVATAGGCFFMVDQLGRVRTMMVGAFFCCVGQILLAAGIANLDGAGAYVAATGLYLFLISFSACWLAPGWTYGAEVAPLAIRTRVAGLGAAMQYVANFGVVEVTPTGVANIGYKYFIPWAVLNAAMIPVLYFFFPEVSQITLEEVDMLFVNGKVHVRHSPNEAVNRTELESFGHPVDKTIAEKADSSHHEL